MASRKALSFGLRHIYRRTQNLWLSTPSTYSNTNCKHQHILLTQQRNLHTAFTVRNSANNIFDYEQSQTKTDIYQPEVYEDEFGVLNVKHGKFGVFDIEDVVEALKHENALNLVVIKVHKSLSYVDYITMCECKSTRHMRALSEFMLKLFKRKRHSNESVPRIEGKESNDWIAIDLGNIALHIFAPGARKRYDIEQLWAVGPEYDTQSNQPQLDYIKLIEKDK